MSKISQKFRHEWKHEINNADIVILRQRLSAVMQKDPNAKNGKYSIRSLYFDNLYDKALLEKLNGINRREKFRIRIYNSDFSFIKLEKKSKINGLCLKETELLTKEEAEKIINSDFDFMKSSEKPLIKELFQNTQPAAFTADNKEKIIFMTFNDIFKSGFLENVTSVNVFDMFIALALAFGLGLFIFIIYKKTFSGVMYSSGFGVSLIALTYHGLDKLSLNNLIQDNIYMKDYFVYTMMNEFGANAPLCSFVYITVNGEDFWLYLAVEGIEDSFLQRNYGVDYGELYKPDSLSFGGGRGNGKDFNMEDFSENFNSEDFESGTTPETSSGNSEKDQRPSGEDFSGFGDFSGMMPLNGSSGEMPDMSGFGSTPPSGEMPDMSSFGSMPPSGGMPDMGNFGGMMGGLGMGSEDVKLQYIDDNPESYPNIFDSAKTDITKADKTRLIDSLETLSTGKNIENVVDIDSVLRYFVVHNFAVNGDSYTGSMIHNYYLYEEDSVLSMLPWDYNFAFGTFMGGNADSSVNNPIDSPLSVSGSGDRPMADWIFQSEEYTGLYHQYFAEFLETVDISAIIEDAEELIAPYVEKDPTKFCSFEEFEHGVATLKEFCSLRAQSIENQLSEGENFTKVDASSLDLSAMGTMSMGCKGGFDRNSGGMNDRFDKTNTTNNSDPPMPSFGSEMPPDFSIDGNFSKPDSESEETFPVSFPAFSLSNIILLVLSLIILPAAIIFAIKYKRR